MDVPFISSGAMSRAHYALVRKVETATSIPAADQLLLTEIETIRERFAHTTLTEVSLACATRYAIIESCAVDADKRVSHIVTLLFHDSKLGRDCEHGLRPSSRDQSHRSWTDNTEQANR